ncbi:TPA: porin OmpL [Klebsiella pneumoniae]|nr:porin OmpL [Klebsiella pneumoniae]
MKKIRTGINVLLLSFAVFSPSVFSAGAWIEARDGYETAYNRHELAFRGGYDFENTAGIMLTNAYNLEAFEQLKHSWNELEGWYPLVSYQALTIYGGALVNENTDGSGGAGYFDFKYTVEKDLSVTLRARYNHRNYDSENNYSRKKPADTLESHLGISYTINKDWNYYLEPAYFKHLNDFHAGNGKGHHVEVDNVLTYTGFDHFQPYVSLAYMDRSIAENNENYRIRLGVRYNF